MFTGVTGLLISHFSRILGAISVDKTAVTLAVGATETLVVTFDPTNATNKNITWTSSDDEVATVDGGVVTGIKAGTATITAKSNNGKEATCVVTVSNVVNATQSIGYDTIEGAILGAADRDIIQIGAGTYEEQISIADRSLTLTGTEGATLRGGLIASTTEEDKSITISDLAFTTAGLEVNGYDTVTISGNEFDTITFWTAGQLGQGSADAIYVHGSETGAVTITNNTIAGVECSTTNLGDGMGITVLDLDDITITGNTISDTWHNSINVYQNVAGIVTIENNTLSDWDSNRDEGVSEGTISSGCEGGRALRVDLAAGATITVTGNTITPNDDTNRVDPQYVKITGVDTDEVDSLITQLIDRNTWTYDPDFRVVILVNSTPGYTVSITSGEVTIYYASIGAAITEAADGDTIVVAAGTYDENISISVDNLQLLSTGNTVLRDEGIGGADDIGINISADNVQIDGFTVENAYAGIVISGAGCSIVNSTIGSCGNGIILSLGTTNCNIENNTINNILAYGIAVGYPGDSSGTTNNTISGNAISMVGADGIYADVYSSNNNYINNTITGTTGNGIHLYKSNNDLVMENTITDGEANGIALMGSYQNDIEDNSISGNTGYGVQIRQSTGTGDPTDNGGNQFMRNTISGNNDNGVQIFEDGDEDFVPEHGKNTAGDNQFGSSTTPIISGLHPDYAITGAEFVLTSPSSSGYSYDTPGDGVVITDYSGDTTNLVVPKWFLVDGTIRAVTAIGNDAFKQNESLVSITLPSTITSIGDNAFNNCINLESVTFQGTSQLTVIGDNSFESCYGLSEIIIPNSVTSIGIGAFAACGFESITFPEGVTVIGEGTFADCDGLASITIPSAIETIGELAFYDCDGLASITILGSPEVDILAFMRVDGTDHGFTEVYSAGGSGTYIYSGGAWVKQTD